MINEVVERILIQRNKTVDDMILGEIRKIATENGVDTIITLNDKAIIQALRRSVPMKPLHIAGYYDMSICSCCKQIIDETERYCSTCGQALDWSDTK